MSIAQSSANRETLPSVTIGKDLKLLDTSKGIGSYESEYFEGILRRF